MTRSLQSLTPAFTTITKYLLCALLTAAIFLCLNPHGHAAAKLANIDIKGTNKAQKENILAHIGDVERDQLSDIFRIKSQLLEKSNTAMQALGYFEPKFNFKTSGGTLVIEVAPGLPTKISSVDIRIDGEGNEHAGLRKIIAASSLEAGKIFESSAYESLKSTLARFALQSGFLDAEFTEHTVEIDTRQRQAKITLLLNTGQQYRFGEFTFEGSAISAQRIQRLADWQTDNTFETGTLNTLQKRLLDTRYFQSIVLERNIDREHAVVHVHAKIIMSKPNKIVTGVGFGTDTGPRAKLGWDKPWVNAAGHSMNFELAGSSIRNSFTTSYQIPSKTRRDAFWKTEFAVVDEDFEDTRSKQENIGLGYVTPLGHGWKGSAFIKYARERFTQGNEQGRSELLLPGVNANFTQSRGGMIPTSGHRYSLTVEAANDTLLSDASFFRVTGNTRWLQSYGRHRLLYGFQLGGIYFYDSTQLNDIPSSLRFFAGGDQSIRGYDYKSLAPRDADNELTGGKYLAVARTEYGYRFAKSWRAALFVDAGSAFNDTSDEIFIGPGVGLHWLSPIGAIRFDIGVAASTDKQLELHISLGPEL